MLPIRITNRLDRGRSVAATAPALHADCVAWAIIEPVPHAERAIVDPHVSGGEPRVRARTHTEHPIDYYVLRYIEIPRRSYAQYARYPLDWDYLLVVASYQRIRAQDVQEIGATLLRWQVDSERLRLPDDVGFPEIGYVDWALDEQSMIRQFVTQVRMYPEHTAFSFRLTPPMLVMRGHGEDGRGPATLRTRKQYAGWIRDWGAAQLLWEPYPKRPQPVRDHMSLRKLVTSLDPSSVTYRSESAWIPAPMQLDPTLTTFTHLDCYNPITYRWSSYQEVLHTGA